MRPDNVVRAGCLQGAEADRKRPGRGREPATKTPRCGVKSGCATMPCQSGRGDYYARAAARDHQRARGARLSVKFACAFTAAQCGGVAEWLKAHQRAFGARLCVKFACAFTAAQCGGVA